MKGLVFAIEEMAVHDGPGLRTAVFLKGCPLRCMWCHNPEGFVMEPQRVKSPNGCLRCGACNVSCASQCVACGKCLPLCPRGLLRISGIWWEPDALARRIRINEPFLKEGGVTVSGGEALMQPEFLKELLEALSPLHRAIETSGYAREEDWRQVLERVEMVYYDIKLIAAEKHREYTGVSNDLIMRNFELLKESGVPFIVRIPVIEGVNDDAENMEATCRLLRGSKSLMCVELLPFNEYAGAKYPLAGLEYTHHFKQPPLEALALLSGIFERDDITVIIR